MPIPEMLRKFTSVSRFSSRESSGVDHDGVAINRCQPTYGIVYIWLICDEPDNYTLDREEPVHALILSAISDID